MTDSGGEVISLECTELIATIVAVAIHAGLVVVIGQSAVIHVKIVDRIVVGNRVTLAPAHGLGWERIAGPEVSAVLALLLWQGSDSIHDCNITCRAPHLNTMNVLHVYSVLVPTLTVLVHGSWLALQVVIVILGCARRVVVRRAHCGASCASGAIPTHVAVCLDASGGRAGGRSFLIEVRNLASQSSTLSITLVRASNTREIARMQIVGLRARIAGAISPIEACVVGRASPFTGAAGRFCCS